MTRTRSEGKQFGGFSSPNYTMVPDELFDELLADLSGAELKVLLYIVRRTFGFKRDSDSISLSQMMNGITTIDGRTLDRGAGLSKPTLLQALRSLQEKGIILSERRRSVDRGDEPTVYSLRFAGDSPGKKSVHPVVKKFDQGGGQETLPGPWSNNLTTQKTVLQEIVKQETDLPSKISKGSRSKGFADDAEEKNNPRMPSTPTGGERLGARHGSFSPVAAMLPEPFQKGLTVAPGVDSGAVSLPDSVEIPSARISGRKRHSRRSAAVVEADESLSALDSDTPQLDATTDYLSSQLGDWQHRRSNRTHARNLMAEFGVPEAVMAQVLHQAYSRTKEAKPHNASAYCFIVARQLLADRPQRRRKDLLGKWAKYHQTDSGVEEGSDAAP